MSKRTNKTLIGAFVIGAIILLIIGILGFGSGIFLKWTVPYVLFFNTSTKGLSVGSPVIFKGVKVGFVKDISLVYDQVTGSIIIPVIIDVYPSRVKGAFVKGAECKACNDYRLMVSQGLRAKLVMQSLLTGELVVSLDFYPDKPAKLLGIMKQYAELPTISSEGISENLENTLAGINKFFNSENVQESFDELRNTLQEVNRSARSFRLLTEYIEEHPEALLKGKAILKGE